jgi:DNA replication protein DnaC
LSDPEPSSEVRCSDCRDSRFVHPLKDGQSDYAAPLVPCRCARDALEAEKRERMLRFCELPAATEHMTFENFERLGHLEEAYAAALAVAEEAEGAKWLTLMGRADRGKTHLAVAICRRWLERGNLARYAYVPVLLDELRRGFGESGDQSYAERFDRFLKVPLLVLDDLGTENPTHWVQEKLDTIVDQRLMEGRSLVVTTNLTTKELTPRIFSRLDRAGRIVDVAGRPYSERRRKKPEKK